jgi:hypothetical protein
MLREYDEHIWAVIDENYFRKNVKIKIAQDTTVVWASASYVIWDTTLYAYD